ncbi:MAG: ATP-binding protein [Syntrophomonadaceae bacterium]|nr:ATP-binding protein [Syntrophomonadaceae bacterium]
MGMKMKKPISAGKDDVTAYRSKQEYLHEVLLLVKQRLALYWEHAVRNDENGQLLQLRNQFVYMTDLSYLTREDDSWPHPGLFERGITETEKFEQTIRQRCEATVDAGGVVALEYLFRRFGLNEFERHCVYLSLAAELDQGLERVYCLLQDIGESRVPTLDLCLRTFCLQPERQREILSEWTRRRAVWQNFFVEPKGGVGWRGQGSLPVKLEARILDYVMDFGIPDRELEMETELVLPVAGKLPPLITNKELLHRMSAFAESHTEGVVFYLHGAPGSGRRLLVRHFCFARQLPVLIVDLKLLLKKRWAWEKIIDRVCRESVIWGALPAFTGFEALLEDDTASGGADGDESGVEDATIDRARIKMLLDKALAGSPIAFLISERQWPEAGEQEEYSLVEVSVPTPDVGERIELWQSYLENLPLTDDIRLEALAVKFALTPGRISHAVNDMRNLMRWRGAKLIDDELLHEACRRQLSHNLGKKAVRVNAGFTWEDLILPPLTKRLLRNACDQVQYRHRVYDQWGFGEKVPYGRGLSMLFAGPPGTGKTMAAQVIARELHLEIYRVDLSGVMSKYIGETEKNLGAVFDEVKKSQSILFFDEADALFAKRSETKDAHDRYANVETSYLLQKMEEYEGIVVLASNFIQNFDEAFKRRIKFIIDFPFPDAEHRLKIWHAVFPPGMPRDDDLDLEFLARSFELSGSSIKNIAVSAAFLAAAEDKPVGMMQILLAVQAETLKAGKSMRKDEFGEYFHLVQGYLKGELGRND